MGNGASTANDGGRLKQLATRGAIWVTLTSVAALPLAYFRSWILGQIGDTGEVVGYYAIILIFVQIVVTFVLFGGTSVVTNFLPKIERPQDKSAFIFTYGMISAGAAVLFVIAINIFPQALTLLLRKPVDTTTLRVLSTLVPLMVLSQTIIYSLVGLMEFRLTSLLSQLQLVLVCTLATAAWLFFPTYFYDHAIAILASTVATANALIIVVGIWRLLRALPGFGLRRYLPPNFWRFSSFIHLNSVSTFAYQSIDQLFVLAAMGTSELGAYYILLQCAQLVTFIPQRIGQVMLASFSRLVADGDSHPLRRAYSKLCRIILTMSTILSVFLICFSFPIASVFGEWCAERHLYLVFLAAAIHFGSLGSVNSMLITAKEKTGLFLTNSIVLITIQLLVTVALLGRWGAYAVIAGKAAGIFSGQIGLFSIVRWGLGDFKLAPPREYWYAIGVVLGVAFITANRGPISIPLSMLLFLLSSALFLLVIRFRAEEVLTILRRKRQSTLANGSR